MRFSLLISSTLLILYSIGCTKDMNIQARLETDNHVAPKPVPGATENHRLTMSGELRELPETSATTGALATETQASLELLNQGREQFEIHCTPCHDRTGGGNGIVVQRGFKHPPELYSNEVAVLPDAALFSVVTLGFSEMPSFRDLMTAEERRAVVSYLRVLQLSHKMPKEYLQPSDLSALAKDKESK